MNFNPAKIIFGLKNNAIYRSIFSLSITAFLAQIIILVGTPFITRIYSPKEFSDISIISAVIQFFGVFATLRYDNAIPLCDNEFEADQLFVSCILSTIIISITIFLGIFILEEFEIRFIILTNNKFIYFIPIGVFLYGISNLLSFYATRRHKFSSIGISRVVQSISSVSSQVILSKTSFSSIGLLVGYLFQTGFGLIFFGKLIILKVFNFFTIKPKWRDLKLTLIKFINFPKYSLLEALMQMFSFQLPFFYLNFMENDAESGNLLNAMKFAQIPMVLIASSLSQVYYGHIKKSLNNDTLHSIAIDILKKIFFIIILPLTFLIPFCPFIFKLYLGIDWIRAGELLRWIIPYIISLIIYGIFSVNFYVKNRFQASLKIQGFIISFRVLVLFLSHHFCNDFTLEIYFLSSALVYFVFSYYALILIKVRFIDIFVPKAL